MYLPIPRRIHKTPFPSRIGKHSFESLVNEALIGKHEQAKAELSPFGEIVVLPKHERR